jgi:colanic acid biosynthesis glycosyl transferase WcaI
VLGAAERLRDDPRILFLMIGGGKRFDELARIVKERRLDRSFRFVPYQQQKMLPYSLAAPDVHWISLNTGLEGLIVPSKFYGIAAAGKPVIAITASDGELARLVQQHSCGVVITPGDTRALASILSRLASDPVGLAEMGMRARKMLEAQLTRQKGFERWRRLLDGFDW